jgi:hypothetical protein
MSTDEIVKEFDNDQIDYLLKVARNQTNYGEPWALDGGFVAWVGNTLDLALTPLGEAVLGDGWAVVPRQKIESYPEPVIPPVPEVPVTPIVAEDAPKEEPTNE